MASNACSSLSDIAHEVLRHVHEGDESVGFLFSRNYDHRVRMVALTHTHGNRRRVCFLKAGADDPSGERMVWLHDALLVDLESGMELVRRYFVENTDSTMRGLLLPGRVVRRALRSGPSFEIDADIWKQAMFRIQVGGENERERQSYMFSMGLQVKSKPVDAFVKDLESSSSADA